MARIRTVVVSGAVGAAMVYFFDPQMGRARRARLRDGFEAAVRHGRHNLDVAARRLEGRAQMAVAQLDRAAHSGPADDLAVLGRVERVLSAVPGLPKGGVDVEVIDGRVVLRGEVGDERTAQEIAGAASHVGGVAAVENRVRVRGAEAAARRAT